MPRPAKYTSVLTKNRYTLNYTDGMVYDHLINVDWAKVHLNFTPYTELSDEEKANLKEAFNSKYYENLYECTREIREKKAELKKRPGRSVEW